MEIVRDWETHCHYFAHSPPLLLPNATQPTNLKLFKSCKTFTKPAQGSKKAQKDVPGDFEMYVGGSVWAMAWVPGFPSQGSTGSQDLVGMLSIAAHPSEHHHNKLTTRLSGPAIVQLYTVFQNAPPTLAYAILHNGGVTHDCKWYPGPLPGPLQGPQGPLGLLAGALGNGQVVLWEMPQPRAVNAAFDENEQDSDNTESADAPKLIKPKVLAVLSTPKESKMVPSCLQWHPRLHTKLLVGCWDGNILLTELKTPSGAETSYSLELIFCINNGPWAIRGLVWAPVDACDGTLEDRNDCDNLFTLACDDGLLNLWDCRSPFSPKLTLSHAQLSAMGVTWASYAQWPVSACEESLIKGFTMGQQSQVYWMSTKFLKGAVDQGAVWGIESVLLPSDLAAHVYCGENGTLHMLIAYDSWHPRRRMWKCLGGLQEVVVAPEGPSAGPLGGPSEGADAAGAAEEDAPAATPSATKKGKRKAIEPTTDNDNDEEAQDVATKQEPDAATGPKSGNPAVHNGGVKALKVYRGDPPGLPATPKGGAANKAPVPLSPADVALHRVACKLAKNGALFAPPCLEQSLANTVCNASAQRSYATTSTTAHAEVATAVPPHPTALPAAFTFSGRSLWERISMQLPSFGSMLMQQPAVHELPGVAVSERAPGASVTAAAPVGPLAALSEGAVLDVAGQSVDLAAVQMQLAQAIKDHKHVDAASVNRLVELLAEGIAQGTIEPQTQWALLDNLGKLQHRPPARVARMLMEALNYSPNTNTQEQANTQQITAHEAGIVLSVLAAFQHTDARLLRLATQAISQNVAGLESESLAGVLSSCGTLQYRDRRLTDVLVGALLWHVSALSPAALANAASGLAKLQHKDAMTDVVLDSIAEAALKRIDSFHPNDLARMCHSFAQLGHWGPSNQRLMDSLHAKMLAHHQRLHSQGVVDVVLASAKTDFGSVNVVPLMDVLCTDVKQHMALYSTAQLVDLLWGLSKLRYADAPLFLLAGREIMQDLSALHARHLADLLFSCAAINLKPSEKLLDAIKTRAMRSLHAMTARELTNTLWALAILDKVTDVHWKAVCEWLKKHPLEDLQPQHLQRAYQAFLLMQTQAGGAKADSLKLPEHLAEPARRSWRDAVYFQQQRCGHLHAEVVGALMQLKTTYELGVLLEDGMFMIDMTVDVPGQSGGVQKVGIAIDQGSHFTCNKPHAPLAHTVFSRRFLASRGVRMVHIEKHRWREHRTSSAKTSYLKRLLDAVGKQ